VLNVLLDIYSIALLDERTMSTTTAVHRTSTADYEGANSSADSGSSEMFTHDGTVGTETLSGGISASAKRNVVTHS
jgi:hypothetical protein